jgi:transposase-like protein
LQGIAQLIIGQPDITIDEIIEKQGLSVSNETVRKAVIRLGYVYTKGISSSWIICARIMSKRSKRFYRALA